LSNKPAAAPIERCALTVKEFCTAHGFSVAQFYRLRKVGLTPSVIYIGRSPRITVESADAWRAQQMARAAEVLPKAS
jgi:predicted DNA-binding transcriptional regulator AlpA